MLVVILLSSVWFGSTGIRSVDARSSYNGEKLINQGSYVLYITDFFYLFAYKQGEWFSCMGSELNMYQNRCVQPPVLSSKSLSPRIVSRIDLHAKTHKHPVRVRNLN